MNDTALRLALSEVCEKRLLLESDCPEIPDSYEFSDSFESSLRQVGLSRRITVSKRSAARHRIRFALFIAVIFAAGVFLGMGKMPLWNFVVKNTNNGRSLSFDLSTADEPRKRIETCYTFTGAPEGYSCAGAEYFNIHCYELWTMTDQNGESSGMIYFAQYIPAMYTDALLGSDAECEYYIDDDGVQYYIAESEDYTSVTWYDGEYVFLLAGSFNKNEGLELCKTVKIKE